MYRGTLIFVIFFFCFRLSGQDGFTKKQLLDLLNMVQADTLLIDTYNELAWPVYSYDNPDSSIYFANKAIALSKKVNDLKRLSVAHRRLGITYTNIGDIKTSIYHQQQSYDLSEKINYRRGMQLALNNIGVAYLNHEMLNKALTYFLKSLKLVEETKNNAGLANLYFNCALIYRRTGELKKANAFLFKAEKISESRHDTDMIAICKSNISSVYRNLNMLDSAKYYSQEAKKYLLEGSASGTKFNYYLNEGNIHAQAGEHREALEIFLNTRPYAVVTNDEITLLINIAEEYDKLRDTEKALGYFQQAYDLSKKAKTYNNLAYLSFSIAKIFESRKDFNKFSEMIRLHLNYKDSNEKYNRVQHILQQQLEFDFERRYVADSIRFEQREHLKNMQLEAAAEKLDKEKYFRIMLVGILSVIILFSIFIFNRFMVTRRQKAIIERQKQIVELKNSEILDSINYTRRLQSAILPQISDIKKELDIDILYMPKDIIGGDFYFFEKYNGHTFFAICDCTGHGIPGALMSVVCHHALQKAIKEFNLTEPGTILDKTRQIIIESLNATQQNIKDGMDCSLLAINNADQTIQWAGANNHVWIQDNNTLTEIKADKQPVAFYENTKSFTTHGLPVQKGDFVYLFTDGYGDQFGGPRGKKFKNKALKEFLMTVYNTPVEKQAEMLQKNFINWKQALDQVDDVAIAVIKV